ncbi:MAG TPA: hypothetical protein VN238_09775, partial [Solirubrobacteraceae bacterium]|nr:hypothetical protein [Solirubrobacteraceae bacterium]
FGSPQSPAAPPASSAPAAGATAAYLLQRTAPSGDAEGRLTITSVDPADGTPRPNPLTRWPDVFADGLDAPLAHVGTPTATSVVLRLPGESPATLRLAVGPVDVLRHRSVRAGAAVWRNHELVPGRTTAPAFLSRTPTTTFATTARASILGSGPIELPGGGIAQALGTFLAQLLPPEAFPAGTTVPIRLAAVRTGAVELEDGGGAADVTVRVLLTTTAEFDPATDAQLTPSSFVTEVERTIRAWAADVEPPAPGAFYDFDLTVFADDDPDRPLIHAPTLRLPIRT